MMVNRLSNNLIVGLLLCFSLINGISSDLDTDAQWCPGSNDSEFEAICVCEIKDVRCQIGNVGEFSKFWIEFGHIKGNFTVIHLTLHQPDSSEVSYFPASLFPNLSPIAEEVNLASWKFKSVPNYRVARTSKVKRFSIVDNDQFTKLGPGSFSPLALHLERLALTSNALQVIDVLAFNGLKKVREISLMNNNLTSLPDYLFLETPSLTNLSLSSNSITIVSGSTFRGLSNLRDLELNHNQLFTIVDDTFRELTSLKLLDLSHNKINSLDPLAFNGLKSLEYVDLSSNLLTTFPPGLLTLTPMLMEIDLKHNTLYRLDDDFLKQLPKTAFLKDNPWNCDCTLLLYEEVILVDNSEAKCETTDHEFNRSPRPVKSLSMTFKHFIAHTREHKNHGQCNKMIMNKEKRSHLTLASTSKVDQTDSSCLSSSSNFSIMMVTLSIFMILNLKL